LTQSIHNETKFTLNPEAAIINFYQNGSIMGGHQDDAEITTDYLYNTDSIISILTFYDFARYDNLLLNTPFEIRVYN
jgi:alkylated DNA repair dioxygenase AlkB